MLKDHSLDDKKSIKNNKTLPLPIQLAQEALETLKKEDLFTPELKKLLPAYAMKLSKEGKELSVDFLVEEAKKGIEYLKAPRTVMVEQNLLTYEGIISDFSVNSKEGLKNRPTEDQVLEKLKNGDPKEARDLFIDTGIGNIYCGEDLYRTREWWVTESAAKGYINILRYLRGKNDGFNKNIDFSHVMYRVCGESGNLDVIKFLIDHGAGSDFLYGGNSPLSLASGGNNLDAVKFLLSEYGANIHLNKNLAIRQATENGHLDTVKLLIEHGAKVSAVNASSLHDASQRGYYDVVKLLIEHGANARKIAADRKESYQNYLKKASIWQKTIHQLPPRDICKENPKYFHQEAFNAIRDILKKEGCSEYTVDRMAFAASALFGTEQRVLQYLKKWGQAGKQPLHDLIYMIKIPQADNLNLKDWGDAVLKCGPAMARMVSFSHRITSPQKTDDGRTWSAKKTKEIAASFAYKKSKENLPLASICFEHTVDEEGFNEALDIVKKQEKKKDVTKNIPDIIIDGNSFGKEGYTFHRLAANDPRGLFLGEYTDCCQSIGGQGDECAEHGFTSKNSGFYVVEDRKNKIVAQTWAWRGKKGELVFDSLESLRGHMDAKQWTDLSKEFAKALSKEPNNVTALNIGTGGATPSELSSSFNKASSAPFKRTATPAKPLDYKGYRDSKSQMVVWKKTSLEK